MNILFYTEQDLTPMTGGIGRISSVLTGYFRQYYGWKVYSIYSKEVNPAFPVTETDGKICLRLHDRLAIRSGLAENYVKAAEYIAKYKIDVVIIQTSLDVVSKLKKQLRKIDCSAKIISVLHFNPGGDEWTSSMVSEMKRVKGIDSTSLKFLVKSLLSPIYNRMIHQATVSAYRTAYRDGDTVMLLSPAYINTYRKYAGISERDKFTALPNCLSFNEKYTIKDLQTKERIALVVARLTEGQKRISLILKIWKRIEENRETKDWHLMIVGEGEAKKMYQQMAEKLRLERCLFEGRQNPVDYYRRASIFLMTSLFEGFPMTLVEAQQFGCVPIVYDAFESLRDVVTDGRNGSIVLNNDEDQYVRTLVSLMTNDEWRQELAANALIDCQRFSQETICNQWKNKLEEICLRKERK